MCYYYRLDGVVCLVDVNHIEQHLDEVKPDGTVNEAVQQVVFADRLLINKVWHWCFARLTQNGRLT